MSHFSIVSSEKLFLLNHAQQGRSQNFFLLRRRKLEPEGPKSEARRAESGGMVLE